MHILALNTGSSSLKFAVYDVGCTPLDGQAALRYGTIDRIGDAQSRVSIGVNGEPQTIAIPIHDQIAALEWLTADLQREQISGQLAAIGHRIVHGGAAYRHSVRITRSVRDALGALIPLAPNHLPNELRAVDAMARLAPELPQIACFDTEFHGGIPFEARWFGIPRSLSEDGVVRYGFHGISYEYVVHDLRGRGAMGARMIVAHLGNGASMAAVRDGRSVDTSMGFTPIGGFTMSTRSGDLDPGVLLYLLRDRSFSIDEVSAIVTESGGLLGLSGTSADMRDLLARTTIDQHAAEAVAVFCYQVRKFLGAYVAVLGGLDTLVFTGGIGENSPEIRARVCDSLDCFGIRIDEGRNVANASIISADGAPVDVHVIRTNEELMIARHAARVLDSAIGEDHD